MRKTSQRATAARVVADRWLLVALLLESHSELAAVDVQWVLVMISHAATLIRQRPERACVPMVVVERSIPENTLLEDHIPLAVAAALKGRTIDGVAPRRSVSSQECAGR